MPVTIPPAVAPNELIESAWGNAVVSGVTEALDLGRIRGVSQGPAGNVDVSSGVFANWISFGAVVPVPDWATRALVQINCTAMTMVTATATFALCASFAGVTNDVDSFCVVTHSAGDRFAASFAQQFTGIATGTQGLNIRARRATGTGVLRADSQSKFTAGIVFA